MLTKTEVGLELQLNVDAAGLWYGAAGYEPQLWSGELDELLATDLISRANSLMVLGTRSNAWLITRLCSARSEMSLPSRIRIGTPELADGLRGSNVMRTRSLFSGMRDISFAGSVGGWHKLTARDAVSYALVTGVADHGDSTDDLPTAVSDLLPNHAAWAALSFLPTLNIESAIRLIAEIVDPRWYSDRNDPDSLQRLFNYLGLKGNKHMRAATQQTAVMSPQTYRTSLLLDTWFDPNVTVSEEEPSHYFYRVLAKHEHKIQGLVEASRLFVVFIRGCWLQALHSSARTGKIELFVPEYFFERPEEARAYREHAALCG